MLQSARTVEPSLDDEPAVAEGADGTTGTVGDTGEHIAVHDVEAVEHANVERVPLREVAPGEDDDIAAAHRDHGGADDVAEAPPAPEEPAASEAPTSLADALDDSPDHAVRQLDRTPPAVGEHEINGTAEAEIGQDTAEDLAALFNAPASWHRDPAPAADIAPAADPEPDLAPAPPPSPADTAPPTYDPAPPAPADTAPPTYEPGPPALSPSYDTAPPPPSPDIEIEPGVERPAPTPAYDTAEDLAALFNAPSPWDRDPAPPAPPSTGYSTPAYDTAEDLAALFNAPSPWDRDPAPPDLPRRLEEAGYVDRPEDPDPAADHGERRFEESAFDPAGTWDTDHPNATYSAAEWPWVGRSGDGGFWAPPKDRREITAGRYPVTRPEASAGHTPDEPSHGTGEQPLVTGERSGELPATTKPDVRQGTGQRLRTAFQELGAWTAVAQVALLAVGMLCIIQVFVLIVVSSYLSDARERGGGVVTGSLAAHAKVDGVMLPALLMFAIIAFAFAVWRSIATPASDGADGARIRLLGLPLTLWPVPFAAVLLLLVILPETPSTVAAAQRITQWAMLACAVLGVACFAAPRGLEVPPTPAKDETPRRRSGTAARSAGSRSVA